MDLQAIKFNRARVRLWGGRLAGLALGLGGLLVVELGLQAVGAGPSNRLFLAGADGYSINPQAAHRFFQHQYVRHSPVQERFALDKPEGTFRVFVLGASTLIGYPNPPATGFPHFLQLMLADRFPGRSFEVVNCGITAINSFCLLDFVDEILQHQPDLVLVYSGHNEFVGPYGVTTPFLRLGNDRDWIRFHMRLQRSKIYYFLKEGIYRLQRWIGPAADSPAFGPVLVQQEVYPSSPEHRITEANYRANLEELTFKIQARGVPVALATLAANLAGYHPLRSQAPHPQGAKSLDIGQHRDLLRAYPHHAGVHFAAGRAFLAAGAADTARALLGRARDLDGIHFRACAPFNRIIREVAAESGALLVDAEGLFDRAAAGGVVGDKLMTDYLHPTVEGHFLLAGEIVKAMPQSLGLTGVDLGELASFDQYCQRLGYTLQEQVHYRNDLILLLSSLPYEERPPVLEGRLAVLIQRQLSQVLKLSYAEIIHFARRGGFDFLQRTIDQLSPVLQGGLSYQLQQVVKPLGLEKGLDTPNPGPAKIVGPGR
ncbi:MAG: hypothetical protein GKR89_21950 [Candidatus Latescibacteria bacterium]|nr:hypothetical protein [Candidatus Latescibacterota bacterium]